MQVSFSSTVVEAASLPAIFPLVITLPPAPAPHTITYKVTDECMNTNTCSFTIRVPEPIVCEDIVYEINDGYPVFCGMVENWMTATFEPAVMANIASISWDVTLLNGDPCDWMIDPTGIMGYSYNI